MTGNAGETGVDVMQLDTGLVKKMKSLFKDIPGGVGFRLLIDLIDQVTPRGEFIDNTHTQGSEKLP